MAMVKNVAGVERVVRAVLGIVLIVVGFLLTGFWKPLSIIIGVCLVASAFAGY